MNAGPRRGRCAAHWAWAPLACLLVIASPAAAQLLPTLEEAPPGGTAKPAGAKPGGEALPESIDLSEMVLAAAKAPVSVLETPSIITIITRQQMLERGYRTLNDVLATVPGFEAPRFNFVAHPDAATRGNFSTVLVLYNGVSVVEPKDLTLPLDRRMPLDMLERIEITSGPGGVLWGANAYLGIINLVTRTGQDFRGVDGMVGYGTGDGDTNAVKANVTLAENFFNKKLRFLLTSNFFTTDGFGIRPGANIVVPVANEPNPNGAVSYRASTTDVSLKRSWVATLGGNISYGPVAFDFYFPWEQSYRPHNIVSVRTDAEATWDDATSKLMPVSQVCMPSGKCYSSTVPLNSTLRFHMVGLRFDNEIIPHRLSLAARLYWVGFMNDSIVQKIWGISVFKSPCLAGDFWGTNPHRVQRWFLDQFRRGGSVDATVQLPFHNRLIVGGEAFQEAARDTHQGQYLSDTALEDFANRTPANGRFTLVSNPSSRIVAAAFAHDEWRPFRKLALAAGVRYESLWSDVDLSLPLAIDLDGNAITPSPYGNEHKKATKQVVLGSAAATYNLFGRTHIKANFAQGFRPPRLGALANGIVTRSAVPGNPNLGVERSQAIEGEINTVVLERTHGLRKLLLRADYSYTTIDNLIVYYGSGIPTNSGHREANSVEVAGVLEGMNPWNVWANYYWVDLVDRDTGPVRYVAHHKVNLGGSVKFWKNHLQLGTVLTLIGPMEDLNRVFSLDPNHPGQYPGTFSATAADLRIDRIGPRAIWRGVVWLRDLVPYVDFQLTVDNLLGGRYLVPDADWQARQSPFPLTMPTTGQSFFLSAWVKL
jgi:outer membrane receptor protein involved in Fe transport